MRNNENLLNDPDLVPPDVEDRGEVQFKDDELTQLNILGAIAENKDVFLHAKKFLSPMNFTEFGHQAVLRTLFDYYDRFNDLPSRDVLMNEISKQYKDNKSVAYYKSVVATLKFIKIESIAYLKFRIEELARTGEFRKLFQDSLKALEKGDTKKAFEVVTERLRRIGSTFEKEGDLFNDLDDIFIEAKTHPIDWVVDNWLMFGGLHLCSGHSFAGKSVLWAELVALISQGIPIGELQTSKTPVLILDLENHASIIHRRFFPNLKDDDEVTWVNQSKARKMLPFDADSIRSLVEQYYREMGNNKCLLLVDTFRSAFQIDEQDQKSITELLYPLQAVAQDLNCAVLLLHHRPKTNAAYAGHNSMMAALDFFMVYEREGTQGKLSMQGTRLDQPEDVFFSYNPTTRRLYPSSRKKSDIDQLIIDEVSSCAEHGITQKAIIQAVQSAHVGEVGVNKIRAKIDDLVDRSILHKRGQNGKGGYRFFPSN